jgi:hypothetical protein
MRCVRRCSLIANAQKRGQQKPPEPQTPRPRRARLVHISR